MDNQDVRPGSREQNSSHNAGDAQRQYGVNWPFPPVGGPKPLTAKQRKMLKAKDMSKWEEALL